MSDHLLMAIDLGTSFIKAGVFDLDGTELAVTKEAVKSESPGPGQFIQHGDDLMDAVERCMKAAADALGKTPGTFPLSGLPVRWPASWV